MSKEDVEKNLAKKGYKYASTLSDGSIVMTKKTSSFGWRQAEIDPDGLVNGEELAEFLKR